MDTTARITRRWIRNLGDLGVQTVQFAHALGRRRESSNGLLVVGTPDYEPWHFVAHLAEEAKRTGRTDLTPTWMRWKVPPGFPSHLSVSVDDIAHASRHQTVLVVSACSRSPELLERVSDAKKRGTRIMAVHRGDSGLADLSHEMLSVDPLRADHDFDVTQHLVTDLAPSAEITAHRRMARIRPV